MSDSERATAGQPRRSFGEDLRRERELRQISLREVAEATKINLRFLEALENNDFEVLPGGFFVRGFIKSYARHIGISEEAMVNAYLMEMSQQRKSAPAAASGAAPPAAPEPAAAPLPARPTAARPAGSSGARLVPVGASLLAFFGLAFLLWNGVRQMGAGAARQAPPAAPPVEAAAAPPREGVAPQPPPPLPDLLQIDLVLRERAWVRVQCDGRELVNRTLEAGSRRSFECREEVSLSASDAGALEVEINGRPLRLPAAGQRLTPTIVRREDWPGLESARSVEETP